MRSVRLYVLALLAAACASPPTDGVPDDAAPAVVPAAQMDAAVARSPSPAAPAGLPAGPWDLAECIRIALANHASGRIGDADVDAAEAQLREAQSARWPQLAASFRAVRLDEDPTVISQQAPLDLGPKATGALADAAALAGLVKAGMPVVPGNPMFDAAYAQASQAARQQFSKLQLPAVTTVIADRDSRTAALRAQFLLYAGGRIDALIDRARAGVDVAQSRRRESDLDVALRVVRAHDAVLLTDDVVRVGVETHENLKVVLDLTKRVYESGSGSATRADWLKASVVTTTVGGLVDVARKNTEIARMALRNAMGVEADQPLPLAASSLAERPVPMDATELLAAAYRDRPDWNQIATGERAAEASVREASAGHLPVVALFAEASRLSNDLDSGVVPSSERSWVAGVSVELPIFEGFAVEARRSRALAEARRVSHLRELLRQGIGTEVSVTRAQVESAQAALTAARGTISEATEHRALQFRAYQADLAKTEDVVEAQIMEAMARVNLLQATYAFNAAGAGLRRAVGSVVAGDAVGATRR